jgi:hypothetical protein
MSTMLLTPEEWGYGKVLNHDFEVIYWYEGIKKRTTMI